MIPFDIAVLVVLGLCLVVSVFRGLVKEIFSLLALVGGFLLALKFQDQLGQYFSGFISDPTLAKLTGFGLVFIVSLIAITLLGKLIRSLLHSAPGFSTLDRVMGGALGLVKGLILLLILIYPLQFFPDLGNKITAGSVFKPYLKQASGVIGEQFGETGFFTNGPSVTLDKMKEGLGKLKDIGKLSEQIKWKTEKNIEDQGEGANKAGASPPQHSHTQKDKKDLNKILLSLDKEK
jgi:membrane protein required for colicin V production